MRRYNNQDADIKYMIHNKECYDKYTIYTIAPDFGEGTFISYMVGEGVEVIYNDFIINKRLKKLIKYDTDAIEISYCLSGQMETEFASNKISYMNDGDISLYGYNTEIIYSDFTKKPYKGITLMLYMDKIVDWLKRLIDIDEAKVKDFFQSILSSQNTIITNASDSLDHIFKEFYAFPDNFRYELMELKVMEALLYLIGGFDYKSSTKLYFSKTNIDKIKEAHSIITTNMANHISIEELSKRVALNSTYLKSGFKDMYGSSIYTYTRNYRLVQSALALKRTDIKISDIAMMYGYTNPSKFSAAFKLQYKIAPLAYRKSKT